MPDGLFCRADQAARGKTRIALRRNEEQHSREIEQLRGKVTRRQQDLERTSKENNERYRELQKELKDYKDKVDCSKMKEGFYYEHKRDCPRCGTGWLGNSLSELNYCHVCSKAF